MIYFLTFACSFVRRASRLQMIHANTLFKFVCYHPDESQIITSGTDRKISYWATYDGSMIRDLEGSNSGSVNGMDITSDGACFVTGGDDQLIKVSQPIANLCDTGWPLTWKSGNLGKSQGERFW